MIYKLKRFKIVGLVIVIILVFADTIFSLYLYDKQTKNAQDTQKYYISKYAYNIADALSIGIRPAVVDPISGDIYLVGAKLVLPPVPRSLSGGMIDAQDQVYYTYYDGSDGIPAEVNVVFGRDLSIDKAKLMNAVTFPDIKKYTDSLEACGRGVGISIQQFYPLSNAKADAKTLNNGERVYIFPQDPLCKDNAFFQYVAQINSY